ncbi:nuclear transport factor 2 family protein [Nocardioides sp. TRM66260-LWL]|uniref:nuclear transport factor 2 family protein n=1 Tax=Nocardioides sp. TRM66260-LWL TaxID=2874478 RepID=UPI001CC4E4B3|nr:nuclear transport factor 2 family protein [Nocardioides sp. TRM66260-LWL]MBZ5732982.1 nuclear transport factor 2 family protein [Nocardioides sp. TRM66260-LWL]
MTDPARAVENVLYEYAELIDAGDLDGVGALLAHARLLADGPDGPVVVAEGREAITALYRSTTRIHPETGTPRTRHVTTNARIEVDEAAGTATARSVYTVLQATDSLALQPIVSGRYEDAFERADDGWRLTSRLIHVDLVGELGQHLLI